jgi:RsiW-degrading membrane proteinase PrsW (M82 family)
MTRALVALLLALFALFALSLTGCSARVAGADDLELTYQTEAEPAAAAPFGQDLRALVLRRISSAGPIGADVTQEGKDLRIVVDEALAEAVDELVTWSGTVLLMEPDSANFGAPHDGHGLTAMTETLPDGTVSHFWQGSHAAVARAVDQWVTDKEHRVVAEAVWSTARGANDPQYRTRIVWARPLGELAEGILVGWGDKGTLRLRAAKGTPAEGALSTAYARASGSPRGELLVRGRTSLGRPTFEPDAAHLSFGTGIEAYARAQDEKQILTTARLPALKRVGAIGLPPNNLLASACFVVPILLSIAWLAFVRRFDRAHPEPMWLIAVTFLLGGLATVPAGFAELFLSNLTPWLDPRVITFGGQLSALPLAIIVFTVVVGLVEETSKLLGASFAVRRREFDEPIDGIVYGIVSSLGFAAAENINYFAMTRLAAPIVIARCFMSVPAHMFFGAIWGYALGARLVEKRSRVLLFLGLAALGHGLFDALLSTDGGAIFAVFLNVVLATVFVSVVRRSLRHGIVEDAVRAILPEHRQLFRVGRPGLFLVSSIALHFLAFGIVMLGGFYQLSRHRPGALFVGGSSAMLALLAIAAFGVSATMPLDVAIDDYGVTFAGAARAWSRIRRFHVHPTHIELDCEAGPIVLGPGSPDAITQIATALRSHLGDNPRERLVTLESVKT